MRPRSLAAAALLALLACGPDPGELAKQRFGPVPKAAEDAGAAGTATEPGPPPPAVSEGEVKRIEARDDVPLVGDRVDARPGDWLLTNQKSVAVVSQKKGAIVDFGAKDGIDAMESLAPTVFGSLAAERLEDPTFEVESEGHVLHMTRRIGKKGRFDAFVFFRGEVLHVESLVTSTGPEPLRSQTLGEESAWGNVPTWIEGVGFASKSGAFPAAFVARESLGLAYAMESVEGKTIARISGIDPDGFHDSPNTGDRTLKIAAHESSPRREIALAWSRKSLGDAALQLPAFEAESNHEIPLPAAIPPLTAIEVARCDPLSTTSLEKKTKMLWDHVVTRFSWDEDRRSIRIPSGCHGVRFTRIGYAPGPWTSVDELASKPLSGLLPVAGTLEFRVREKGGHGPMPARLLVLGERGTANPNWGDDPFEGAVLNTIYSAGEGQFPIPPGHYRVLVQRGFEYTAVEKKVDVDAGKVASLDVELERVVDTAGWISADCHVHAAPSFDAPSPLPDRIRSLAASGVEVAVATDHNKVTDYTLTIRAQHLEKRMTSLVGDEITTKEPSFGHFNAFPLKKTSKPIPWEESDPAELFAAARAEGPPGIVPIVQVNHPLMGSIGYFELMRFDGDDIARWKGRSNEASLDFDALEVFNGDHYEHIAKVEDVMKDWYALLKAGFRVTATGNSDSHKLTYAEAGVPRNFVRVANDDPATLDPKEFVEAIRRGRVVVSSGPFVRIWVDGHEEGDEVAEGEHEIEVRVDAAPWVDVDQVDLVVKGEVAETWDGPFAKGAKRFDKKIKKQLGSGDFVLAIARSRKSMTFLHRSGAKPFGFTNPVFVR